jgi:hypothetical protein
MMLILRKNSTHKNKAKTKETKQKSMGLIFHAFFIEKMYL